jgi:hypothetical protein
MKWGVISWSGIGAGCSEVVRFAESIVFFEGEERGLSGLVADRRGGPSFWGGGREGVEIPAFTEMGEICKRKDKGMRLCDTSKGGGCQSGQFFETVKATIRI